MPTNLMFIYSRVRATKLVSRLPINERTNSSNPKQENDEGTSFNRMPPPHLCNQHFISISIAYIFNRHIHKLNRKMCTTKKSYFFVFILVKPLHYNLIMYINRYTYIYVCDYCYIILNLIYN